MPAYGGSYRPVGPGFSERLSATTVGERAMGVSGAALFLFSFFTWFELGAVGKNAWGAVLSLIGVLLAVALVVVLVLRHLTAVELPPSLGGLNWDHVYLTGAGASFGFVLLQILVGQSAYGTKLLLTPWAAIGLLAAGAMLGGALTCLQGRRTGPEAAGPPS